MLQGERSHDGGFFAALSLCEPAFALLMKISASSPLGKNDTVETYLRPLHGVAKMRTCGRPLETLFEKPTGPPSWSVL